MKKILKKLFPVIIALAVMVSMLPTAYATPTPPKPQKNFVVYFTNWGVYSDPNKVVGAIPWDKVTVINHAFFTINNEFKLVTTDEWADFQKQFEHSMDLPWGNDRGHFAEYKYYKTQFPNVKVMVSVGGWTRGENFHAMASTPQNRAIFIQSVVDFLKQYPFIDGIDLDWEYPGVDRPAPAGDPYDRGCPGGPEDKVNFTVLLKELREAYNSNGLSDKLLTIALAAGYDKVDLIEPGAFNQYLDFINVMTYDMHGAWDINSNHQSPIYANPNDPSQTSPIDVKNKYNIDYIIKYLKNTCGVSGNKLNLGSPFYSHGWKVDPTTGTNGLFAKVLSSLTQNTYSQLRVLENTPGYQKFWDPISQASWLYNASEGMVYSYDDENSLIAKCNYVLSNDLGGIMAWEITGDEMSTFPLTTLVHNKLFLAPTTASIEVNYAGSGKNNNYNIKVTIPTGSRAQTIKIYEGDTLIKTKELYTGSGEKQVVTCSINRKPDGTYTYRADLINSYGTTPSANLVVNVGTTKK